MERLHLDLIDEAEIRLEPVYEVLGRGRIPVATAGPVGGPKLNEVHGLDGVLDGFHWEVVGAGRADAVDDAVPWLVRREEAVGEVCGRPVVPVKLILACGTAGAEGDDVDVREGGDLRAGPQALQLAELVGDNELPP